MNKRALHFAKSLRVRRQRKLTMGEEEGQALVEMALVCLILLPVLLGIIQLSLALYCYHFSAAAAREATRFAIVRGADCATTFSAAFCSPTDGGSNGATANDIAQYVNSLGYPFSGTASTTVNWCINGGTYPATWTSCSPTQNNIAGNQVQVKVTYSYPLAVPFLNSTTINMGSVSSMTIVQ